MKFLGLGIALTLCWVSVALANYEEWKGDSRWTRMALMPALDSDDTMQALGQLGQITKEARTIVDEIGQVNVDTFAKLDENNLASSLAALLEPQVKPDVDLSDLRTFRLLYDINIIEVCSHGRRAYKLVDLFTLAGRVYGPKLDGNKGADLLKFLSICRKIENDITSNSENLLTQTHSKLIERISPVPRKETRAKKPSWAKKVFGSCFRPTAVADSQ